MTPTEYQAQLLKVIDDAVNNFNDQIPAIERQAMDRIIALSKELEVKNGTITNSAANLKKIGQLRSVLESAIINEKLAGALQKFVDSFNVVAEIHRRYFGAMDPRKPDEILKELQLQAKTAVINKMTGEIDIRLIPAVEEILRTSITSGGTYQSLLRIMQDFILGTSGLDGSYAKLSNLAVTITIDSLNTFSAQYSKQLTDSLNLQWRMYVGSNLTTTREWCEWMTKKKYVHVREFPEILKGHILNHEVKIREKTKLWDGAKEGTNAANIEINRGGWKCGHQFLAVPEASVPLQIRIDTYNKYGIPHINGIASKQSEPPAPVKLAQPSTINLNSIKNLIQGMPGYAQKSININQFEAFKKETLYGQSLKGPKTKEENKQVAQTANRMSDLLKAVYKKYGGGSMNRALQKLQEIGETKEFVLKDLIPFQGTVSPQKLIQKLEGNDNNKSLPVVVKIGEKYYLEGGTHRVLAAILRGEEKGECILITEDLLAKN